MVPTMLLMKSSPLADRNDIELSAGGALSPRCGTGVGCV
jgi:hypothetical protein